MRGRLYHQVGEPTREKIVKLVNANPRISLKEIAAAVHISDASNIHYHVRRLEKAGLIKWLGSQPYRGKRPPAVAQKRNAEGMEKLPKLSKAQLAANIEKVVAKAREREAGISLGPNEDVLSLVNGTLFRSIGACKVG